MPRSGNVDERIVEMRIDNQNFERGAKETISTLEKLEKALHLGGKKNNVDATAESIEKLGYATSKFDASPMADSLEKVKVSFSALEVAGMRVISNLTDSIYNFTTRTLRSFTIDPVQMGWTKFGEKTTAVSTLTAQGYELEKVNALMEQLNWFTDETSYNFTDMVGNIAKFTATGQNLDSSVTAMEGIALWAALSGQNAQKASMAMYQLSQAMGKGALKYDDYKSIQNASMDTQEFRKQAVAAAEALGVLRKVGEDTWEVLGSGSEKNGPKSFDLAGLFSSDALSRTQWFTSDVMMNVFNTYSKAVKEIQRYMDDNGIDTASTAMAQLKKEAQELADSVGITLDEAFKRLGYDLDEFSLKAFEAGQNARTWVDVIDSVKDAVSTGWMTTFEKFFGDAETATKFWTDIANRFYDIFAEPGNIRNEILDYALGGKSPKAEGVTKVVSGWTKLQNKLEASGHTIEEFEKVYSKVISESNDASVRGLADEFDSVEEAFKSGKVAGDLFKQILEEITGQTAETADDVEETAVKMSGSLQEMRDVALQVLRGDLGNGEERRKAIEELGYDYEIIQAMAGQLKHGGYEMSDEQLLEWMEMYYQFNDLGERLGAESFIDFIGQTASEVEEVNSLLSDTDGLYNDIVNGVETVEETMEDAKTGGEYFRESLTNILQVFMDIQSASRDAFTQIFGDEEAIGGAIYKLIKCFHAFTEAIQIGENGTSALTNVFKLLYTVLRLVGKGFGLVGRVAGGVVKVILRIVSAFAELINTLDRNGTFRNFARAFRYIFEGIREPLKQVVHYVDLITRPYRFEVLSSIMQELSRVILAISQRASKLAFSFRQFMTSDKVVNGIKNAFRIIAGHMRTFEDWFRKFNLSEKLSGLWSWLRTIFQGIGSFITSGDLSWLENVGGWFSGIGEAIKGIKFDNKPFNRFIESISEIAPILTKGIFENPEEVKEKVKQTVQSAFTGLLEGLKGITLSDIFDAVKLSVLTVFISELTSALRTLKDIPASFSNVLGGLNGVLQGYAKRARADAYIKMAVAIGILAGSLWLLSKIPSEDLTHAAVVLSMVILVLSVLAKKISGITKFLGGDMVKISVFNGLAAKLFGIGIVIAAIAALLTVIKKSNITQLVTAFIGIITLFGAMALLVREMGKVKFADTKGVVLSMLAMALSLQMIMIPLLTMAALPWTALARGLVGIAGLLIEFGLLMAAFSTFDKSGNTTNILKIAGSMAIVAVAIGLLLVPLSALALMPEKGLGKAFSTLIGLIAVLALVGAAMAAIGKINNGNGVLKVAAALGIIALAINFLIPAIIAMTTTIVGFATTIPWEKLTERISAFHDALLPLGELAIIMIGFGMAIALVGIGVAGIGVGFITAAVGVGIFAVAIFLLVKAFDSLIGAFPKIVDGFQKVGEMWSTPEGRKKILLGVGAFVLLAVAMATLVKVLSIGGIGTKFNKFTTSIIAGIGNLVTKMGSSVVDHIPSLLKILGTIIVLAALYFVGIIPDLVEIMVQGIVTLFNSLATSIDQHKGELVSSVTSIVKTVLDVLSGVISGIFSKEFFSDLDGLEIALLGLGSVALGGKLIKNMVGPFKQLGTVIGSGKEGTGLIGKLTNSESLIGKIVESAGGLGSVLGIVGALAAAAAYANSNLNQQQEILREQVFEGHEQDVDGYAAAISALKTNVDELQASADAGWSTFATDQELEAKKLLLTYLTQEYEELKAAAEQAIEAEKTYAETSTAENDTAQNFEEITAAAEKSESAIERIRTAVGNLGLDFEGLNLDEKLSGIAEDKLGGLASSFETMAGGIDQGTADGLLGGMDLTNGAMGDVATGLINQFLTSLDMHSPSRVMAEQAHGISTGIAQGINQNQVVATKAIDNLIASLINSFAGLGNRFSSSGVQVVQGLVNGISANYQAAYNTGANLAASVENGFRNRLKIRSPSKVFEDLAGYMTEGLSKGIANTEDTAITSVVVLGDALVNAITESMMMVSTIANTDSNFTPRITPVVDMTGMRNVPSDVFSSALGGYNFSRVNEVNQAVNYSLENSEISNAVRGLTDKVDLLGERIANMEVVLDSGALVGSTSERMDAQLGKISARRRRAN